VSFDLPGVTQRKASTSFAGTLAVTPDGKYTVFGSQTLHLGDNDGRAPRSWGKRPRRDETSLPPRLDRVDDAGLLAGREATRRDRGRGLLVSTTSSAGASR